MSASRTDPPPTSLAPSAPPPDMPHNAPQCPAPEKILSTHPHPTPPTDLSPRQSAAIHLLAHGLNNSAVSHHLGIDRKTLFRWRQDPAFRHALADLLAHLADSSTDRFLHLVNSSLTTFKRQLKDPHPLTALRAARALLSMAPISAQLNYPPPRPRPPLPPIIQKIRSNQGVRQEQSHAAP
ncbi:MAG TPA: phBC6A51 family helix-turn-helix protein [Tepidisphaeraceae bacterium]|nr:phBC6A51 family helix-turn-helix protein [Tepidisphaeraceae bacterium]